MSSRIQFIAGTLWVVACLSWGDTFTHRPTGKVFHGFPTQKTNREQTMIFNAEDNKFLPVNLAEYEVRYDKEGRKNIVTVIPIQSPEILLSEAVAKEVADLIITSSNNGPRLILLDIDSPGGSGEFMKIISSAIVNTRNCPIVAYVSGSKFGGAYASSAVLALSCSKIYISPHAVLGTVCPIVNPTSDFTTTANPVELYSPANLGAYRSYAASLARQAGRNEILAMALVDQTMDVIEVKGTDGKQSFIDRRDRQPTETIIRSWTHPKSSADPSSDPSQVVASASSFLSLTAQDALSSKMVDGIAVSPSEVLKALGVSDAEIIQSRSIDQVVKRFQANKKTVNQALATIDLLQKRSDELHKQIQEVETQIRTGTVTREYRLGNDEYYTGTLRTNSRSRRQEMDQIREYRRLQDTNNYSNRRPYGLREGERYTAETPAMPLNMLVAQLNDVLTNLTREYRRVISLSQKYPGTLPPGISIPELQQKLNASTALQNELRRAYLNPLPY